MDHARYVSIPPCRMTAWALVPSGMDNLRFILRIADSEHPFYTHTFAFVALYPSPYTHCHADTCMPSTGATLAPTFAR